MDCLYSWSSPTGDGRLAQIPTATFSHYEMRERETLQDQRKKRRHMSKEVTWLYQEIELGELKNNTNGDKRRGLCDYALNTIITPLKTELLCNCMHRNEKPTR